MRERFKDRSFYADDLTESVGLLIRLRLPWLIVGLIGGFLVSFIISRFEEGLSKNISLAFFLPFIVYMSDAVGTQTENIYIRNLAREKINFWVYLLKEFIQGVILGSFFGLIIGFTANFWLKSENLALTMGLSMFITMSLAPIVALIVPEILFKEHKDPALGAGPFTTIIQNIISVAIYFAIASFILFK